MRLAKLSVSISLLLTSLAFSAISPRAQDTDASSVGRRGSAPRSAADKYHANAKHGGVSIGAELLSRKEVTKEFAADVNRCCLVVQVAIYPQKDEPLTVSLDDFTLVVEGADAPMRPESATVISARLEKEKGSSGGVATTSSAGIGYESGTYIDPVTGQPVHVHGVSTSAGVAVGVTDRTPATIAEQDREVIERELSEKGLPELKIVAPVSGYLYFSLPKQKKDAKYCLEYVVRDQTLNLQLQ